MKFIVSATHGAINPRYIRRVQPATDGLTIHLSGEGPLTVTGAEAADVQSQLESLHADTESTLEALHVAKTYLETNGPKSLTVEPPATPKQDAAQ